MILIAFGLATMNSFLNVVDGRAPPAALPAAVSPKKVTKIYCEVKNGVKSRVTLDKTTSLQVKII